MSLFGKKKKTKEEEVKTEETPQQEPEKKPRIIRKAALTSGRMASIYQKLYCWVFSVNVTMDVYQIESGEDTFAETPLLVRGYYHDLLERLSKEVYEDQQEEFKTLLSAENIQEAIKDKKTYLTGLFCARELGKEEPEAGKLLWYEFRVEWGKEVNLKNIICVLSVRHASSDLDTGKPLQKETFRIKKNENGIDWNAVRSQCFNADFDGMKFEYNVKDDVMTLHRVNNSPEADRVTKNFTATLRSRADFLIFHDDVKSVLQLLQLKNDSGVQEERILYRKDGVVGAPFQHYRMVTAPVPGENGPEWVVGHLINNEEAFLAEERNKEIAEEMGDMLNMVGITMYQINTNQGTISQIVQEDNWFRREEKPQKLKEYIEKRVTSGRIAPESQKEYLSWLENGYLQRKTAHGAYEFEAKMQEIGDTEQRWYMETLVAVKGKQGMFMRWRREDTKGHEAREANFASLELSHIAEYNGQMMDTLASLVEFRNVESTNHIAHVRELTKILLEDMMIRSPQYEISKKDISLYLQASTMHDIGKITVPDYILNKEGKFTPEEFTIMKRHTTDGAAIVERLNLPGQDGLKKIVYDVVLHHHERFDGQGYPDKLEGDAIAIGVQVVSLADVYDALVSERCYKKGYVSDEAFHMILSGECGAFNPCLLESMKACEDRMRKVYDGDENIYSKY